MDHIIGAINYSYAPQSKKEQSSSSLRLPKFGEMRSQNQQGINILTHSATKKLPYKPKLIIKNIIDRKQRETKNASSNVYSNAAAYRTQNYGNFNKKKNDV